MSLAARWRDSALVVAAILALWQAINLVGGDNLMTSPLATVRHAADMVGQARFWPHLRETVTAYLAALAIAVFGGIGFGVLLGAHRLTGEVAEPIFVALYSIPKVTLYPVILLAFGLGIQAKIAFGALHGIIPIVIFSLNAVRQVNRTWLRTARTMSLTPMQTVRHVIIPATVPEIFSGLRVGAALTLLGTMLGELFASQRGLGFLLMTAIDLHDVKTIMAIALLITLFSVAMNAAMLALDRRLHARF
ncbi:ABC transporter permease [Vineibacter terrae]|uniref:ABC transporter permease n=1 Tax=Vineibacter terrae TaxID=2586908 RepID=UPI002E37FB28|nr:ABC transporter permease subunit [Vineibacter terrae]HEX2886986.1 ABC transporter permease subunit [Vineibacter terrae]